MSTATPPTTALLTAEEYAALPDEGRLTELVKGVVIDMPSPTPSHGYICGNLYWAIRSYVQPRDLGRVVTNDSGVITERGPDTLRGPDVAYYSFDRVPRGPLPEGYWPAPELAVEVRSPSERMSNILAKVSEYLTAGVSEVWLVEPTDTTVLVYSEEFNRAFGLDDELTSPRLFPDLRIPVRSLFE